MPLGENVKQVLHSLKYVFLYCLLSVASGHIATLYAENGRISSLFDIYSWGDTMFSDLLRGFVHDTVNVLLFNPWSFMVFISVYTLPTWSNAVVTFLDENGLQFIGDTVEFFLVSESYQSRRNLEDYSDLPELVGDNNENYNNQNDNIHIFDEHVYHPIYGVVSKSMLIQWGEWPAPAEN